jgi:hypothetical protein
MSGIEIGILANEQGVTDTEIVHWCRYKGMVSTDANLKTRLSDCQAEMIRDYAEDRVIVPTKSYVHSHSVPLLHIMSEY